jgi:hypothetical protein
LNPFSTTGIAAITALLLLAAPAAATTVIEKDLSELSAEADLVFVGRVAAVESRWRDEERRAIETVVTFDVLESLYGDASGQVKLPFAGGELDGLREVVAGLPQFTVGEQVVVFATEHPGISPIVGFHQGCFRVVTGPTGPVVLNAENAPVTGVQGRNLSTGQAQQGPAGAMPLDRFLDGVRDQLRNRTK